MKINNLKFFNIQINKVDYSDIFRFLMDPSFDEVQKIISYANIQTINLALKDYKFGEVLNKFSLIHPDGIGVFLASKFLYGKGGFTKRITGSDFYVKLINKSLKEKWSIFFFGDTEETLSKIQKRHPELKIAGICNGFNFNNDNLINEINNSNADIVIVGLGSPKQEEWIISNKNKIYAKVTIAVGDGIKVFAGIKKRGTKFIQKIGLEWFVRLIHEPKRLWRRYLIGIPLFIFRVINYKLTINKIGKQHEGQL